MCKTYFAVSKIRKAGNGRRSKKLGHSWPSSSRQGVKAEGIAIGVKKEKETQMNNLLSYIKKTMVQTNMSLEEVMNMFGLTPEVKQVVIQKFKEGK